MWNRTLLTILHIDEERMNTVTRRSEAAIASMTKTQKENPRPSLDDVQIKRAHSAKDKRKIPPALKTFMADLTEKLSPPVPTPNGSSDCKGTHICIKKEAENPPTVEESKQSFELKAVEVKVEHLSSDHSSRNPTNTKQGKLSYPPLPPTTFPSILSIEGSSYNLPGRPIVNVALIKKPVGVSVLWSV